MNKRVLIIGAGQLGSRHLQGVLRCPELLDVHVVDTSSDSLSVAKQRAEEVPHHHSLIFNTDYNSLYDFYDVVIVATSSHVREKVVMQLSERMNLRHLVLEKVLFQEPDAYQRSQTLFNQKQWKVWVNHPRRMFPVYQQIKEQITRSEVTGLTMQVAGNNWGLACNGLHFIDAYCYLMNTRLKSVDTHSLDNVVHASKRDGFIEFTGSITTYFENGGAAIITSFDKPASPITLALFSESHKWIVQEGGTAQLMKIDAANKYELINESITIPFQSELSAHLISQLLTNDFCDLPDYNLSMNNHCRFIDSLLRFYNHLTHSKQTLLPIT
jgi:predicted dehydrogenase